MVVRLLVVVALLFGSVVVPAVADNAAMAHEVEMIDTGCHAEAAAVQSDTSDRESPAQQPTQHVDHHHCSLGLRAEAPFVAHKFVVTASRLRPLSDAETKGFLPGPLTEPPAA